MNSLSILNMDVAYNKQQEFIDTAVLAIEVKKAVLRSELTDPIRVIQIFIQTLPQALTTIISDPDQTNGKVMVAQVFAEALKQVVLEDFGTTLSVPKKQSELDLIVNKFAQQEVNSIGGTKALIEKLAKVYNAKKVKV